MPLSRADGHRTGGDRARGVRIAVTGVGLVTPLGRGVEESWQKCLSGERAGQPLDAEILRPPNWSVGADWEPDPGNWFGAPAARNAETPASRGVTPPSPAAELIDPVVALARDASREAWNHAGLATHSLPSERLGCVFGTSKGGLQQAARAWWDHRHGASGLQSVDEGTGWWPNVAARDVATTLGIGGPILCPVAACATGVASLIRGAALLRDDLCDVVVAGSSDASLQWPVLASFRRLGVLADPGAAPEQACRPFDRSRTGLMVGEGAAALVLERWEHAVERGAPILAEWLGGMELGDASGLTAVDASAEPLRQLVLRLLQRTGVVSEDVQGVSAHGTGTRFNDAAEGRALFEMFCDQGRRSGPAVFGLKGGIGHLLGAAGSVEAAACVLALRDQVVPPTVNLTEPEIPLDFVRLTARPQQLRHLLKVSLGFGGHLAACLFRHPAVDGDLDDLGKL